MQNLHIFEQKIDLATHRQMSSLFREIKMPLGLQKEISEPIGEARSTLDGLVNDDFFDQENGQTLFIYYSNKNTAPSTLLDAKTKPHFLETISKLLKELETFDAYAPQISLAIEKLEKAKEEVELWNN